MMGYERPGKPGEVCEHGSLKRKCADCDVIAQDKYIEELEAKNKQLRFVIGLAVGTLLGLWIF